MTQNKGAIIEVMDVMKGANHTYLGGEYVACIDPKVLSVAIKRLEDEVVEPLTEDWARTDRDIDIAMRNTIIKEALANPTDAD